MEIIRFPLGQMQANCYLVIKEKDCLLIDPADSADFILEEIQRRSLHLVGMIATHGHFDHVMAVGEIQLSFPQLPLYIHPKDLFLLKRLGDTAKHFLGYDPQVIPIKETADFVTKSFTIGNFQLEVMHNPGHTPGSSSLYFREEAVVFTGDTLFKDGVGRYDFSYSDKKDLRNSVKKILDLPEFTTIYSGHGEETLVMEEKIKKTIELLGQAS